MQLCRVLATSSCVVVLSFWPCFEGIAEQMPAFNWQALLREQTTVEKLAKSVHQLRDDAGDGITDDSVSRNLHHRFACATEFGCIGRSG